MQVWNLIYNLIKMDIYKDIGHANEKAYINKL